MDSTNASTLPDDGAPPDRPSAGPPSALGLAIVWSSEPGLVGRVFLVPPTRGRLFYVLGRGLAKPDDPHPRLLAIEHRPGAQGAGRILQSPRISRVQLELCPLLDRHLLVRNVGRCRMLHNGRETTMAELRQQDLLQLGNQLLLLCVRRPAWSEELPEGPPRFPFGQPDRNGLVGESPSVFRIRKQIEFLAERSLHVLIVGESGTGKEVVARAIHQRSSNAPRPMVARNATTFPETLIDAELFGNAKNYPNPGMPERPGLFGLADGTILFLDEIADLPAPLQAHLLRVLDAGEYQRLGEGTLRRSAFRLIGATNRPEQLREDLAARFKFRVDLPGLNERLEDVPLLVHHLLRCMAGGSNNPALRFFPNADLTAEPRLTMGLVAALVTQRYRTHVRQLERMLWASLEHSAGNVLDLAAEPAVDSCRVDQIQQGYASEPVSPSTLSVESVVAALEANDWVIERAWRALGLGSRHVLARLMTKYGVRQGRGSAEGRPPPQPTYPGTSVGNALPRPRPEGSTRDNVAGPSEVDVFDGESDK